MSEKKDFDIVVIGAGISGIYAAKFYLDIHPNSRLAILDRDTCVGGTWNSRRGYESFWTQWTVGTAEFSDLPMPQPPAEDCYYNFFKAKHTTNYLESYVDHQVYAGKTLGNRIVFGVEVQSVEKVDGRWDLKTKDRGSGKLGALCTKNLIVASGLTSIPKMPSLVGEKDFGGPIIHQENFGSSDLLSSPDIQKITVLGGGKSSADMVYSAVKAGKNATWVLRETETTGPGFFLSPKGKGPYKNAFDIAMARFASNFTPSFLNGGSALARFLHSTTYGVKIIRAFWGAVDAEAKKDANFERENIGGFQKLTPHSSIFWQNATGGLLNQVDFFDTIAKHVRVHASDVLGLEKGEMKLKNGEAIVTDAILCGTGWMSSLRFFTEDQCRKFGLPYQLTDEDSKGYNNWLQLESAADETVIAKFPLLASPPPHYHRPATVAPYRLYKNIAPLPAEDGSDDRSIVFIGHITVGNYFPAVQCQAMWATAYMDGKLNLPSREDQQKDVALFRAWCRRRYLSRGEEGNNMTFELFGYIDSLLGDLGLSSHRRGWFKDMFVPCTAREFAGLEEEYVGKYGCDKLRDTVFTSI